MRPEHRAGGLIAVAVFGGIAATAVAFVYFGSRVAVYAALGIVPLLILIGAVWVRNVRGTSRPGAGQLTERKARTVGGEFESFWESYQEVRTLAPEVLEPETLGIDRVISKLEANGMAFDRDSGTVSRRRFALFSEPDIESLVALEDEIEEIERELETVVTREVRNEIERLNGELRRLDDIVAVSPPRTREDVADAADENAGFRETVSTLRAHRGDVAEVVREALESTRRSIDTTGLAGETAIETPMEDAENALDEGEIAAAVDELLTARAELRNASDDEFTAHKRAVVELLETVAAGEFIFPGAHDHVSRIEELAADIEEITDPTELARLRTKESAVRNECVGLVESLETEIADARSTLDAADLPDDYYLRPPDSSRDFPAELREAETVDEFRNTFEEAVAILSDRFDALVDTATVVEGYEPVADEIDERLQQTGEVTPADLPVREHETEFMRLYAARNSGVIFDADVPELQLAGSDESYALAVAVTIAADTGTQDIEIDVENDAFSASKTVTTSDAAKVIFESVPFGEYTVRALPTSRELGGETETVAVDEERTVSFILSPVGPKDRLCEGIDDPERILEDLEPRVTDRFDRAGMLKRSMDFPIEDRYVGCLLAQWADKHDKAVSIDGDEVVVYDEDQLVEELQRVAKHNLDAGDRIPHSELRDRFLTPEVPDRVIESYGSDLDAIQVDSRGLRKEGS